MKKLFVQTDTALTTLKEEAFTNELALQILLEQYPELIPSDEIIGNPSFFLIQREFPVSTGYIDHLFVDQMMVPTIVETKVNNPEIRRKIIGQGYEYLTSISFELNGKQLVEAAKQRLKDGYASEVQNRLGVAELNIKEIDKNLKKPRLRLIFAADFIPRELRKFVEFINNASRGIDVYAVQIEQFLLDDKKIISVSTWGPTESVIHDKSVSMGVMTKEEFINKINQSEDMTPQVKEAFIQRITAILDFAEEQHMSVGWGSKSFRLTFDYQGKDMKLLEFYYRGEVYVNFLPPEERKGDIMKIYEDLNTALDLQKKYLKPENQFKLGVRRLHQLTEEQYKLLLQTITSLSS